MGKVLMNRADRRAARKRRPNWKCCSSNRVADTGRYSRGLHNHAATPGPLDHATGARFSPDDSTTRAVLGRLMEIKAYKP